LRFSQTDILGYLEDSWNRAEDARSKPWNMGQQQQAFIDYSVEVNPVRVRSLRTSSTLVFMNPKSSQNRLK
jgi:hypothetical protein